MGRKKKDKTERLAATDPSGASQMKLLSPEKAKEADLISKLQDPRPMQKVIGCNAVAHVLSESQPGPQLNAFLDRMVKQGAVKLLLRALFDVDPAVPVAAAAALRNFSAIGGPAACEELVKQDILSTLFGLFNSDLQSKAPERFQALFTQVFAILVNVSSNSDLAVSRFTQSNLLNCVFACLQPQTSTPDLMLQAAQFLSVVTEDNQAICQQISTTQGSMEHLASLLLKVSIPSIRILSAIVITNVLLASPSTAASQLFLQMFPVLLETLNFRPDLLAARMVEALIGEKQKHDAAIEAILKAKKDRQSGKKGKDEEDEDDDVPIAHEGDVVEKSQVNKHPEAAEQERWEGVVAKALGEWKHFAVALKRALELLTNLCSQSPEQSQVLREVEKHTQEFVRSRGVVDLLLAHMTIGTRKPGQAPDTPFPDPVQMCNVLLQQISLEDESNHGEEAKQIPKLLAQIRLTSANCLGNLVSSLGSNTPNLASIWTYICELCTVVMGNAVSANGTAAKPESEDSEDVSSLQELDAIARLMWTILRQDGALARSGGEKGQLQLVLNLARQDASVETKVQACGMLGTIGQTDQYRSHNFVIGTVLLSALASSDTSPAYLEVIAEALNSIFDIYGEDGVHVEAMAQLSLLPKLAQFLPMFEKRIRASRTHIEEALADRCEEAVENLAGFLDYKKKQK